ncbi:hypothetical protein DFH09DRAFT_1286525 [Mycena vulgaris]|nr:hypothetical protein DFH09DRAFT_1286525 [Mycena vulgaris]
MNPDGGWINMVDGYMRARKKGEDGGEENGDGVEDVEGGRDATTSDGGTWDGWIYAPPMDGRIDGCAVPKEDAAKGKCEWNGRWEMKDGVRRRGWMYACAPDVTHMHPELEVQSLSNLPVSYRAIATSAAKGSLQDLLLIHSIVARATPPASESRFLVCVYYANLDPADVPALVDVDIASGSTQDSCHRAALSLTALAHLIPRNMPISAGVARIIWPRIWIWIRFLDQYGDAIPILRTSEPDLYPAYATLIHFFRRDAEDLIEGTPGLHTVLTKSWKSLLHRRPLGGSLEGLYTMVTRVILHLINQCHRTGDPLDLEEIIEGAGGSIDDLASLLKSHLCAILQPHSLTSEELPLRMLTAGALFMSEMYDGEGPVNRALISHGIIKAQITVLCSFTNLGPSLYSDGGIEDVFLPHFLNELDLSPGYPGVRQALKGGLLRAIITRCQRPEIDHGYYKELLTKTLPRSMVYHSVLSQLRDSIFDVADVQTSLAFQQSDVYREWCDFLDLAKDRLYLMEQYDSESRDSRDSCYNIDCGAIKQRSDFFRCVACQDAIYCSVDCQTHDWREGRHRDLCTVLKLCPLRPHLSHRDKSFLRALVHDGYVRYRKDIFLEQAVAMGRHPTCGSSATFDYCHENNPGPLYVTATGIEPNPHTPSFFRPVTRPSRAAMEVHIVRVAIGKVIATAMLPMRICNPGVREELRRISREIPTWTEAKQVEEMLPGIYKRIQDLAASPMEEFH